MKLSLSPDSPIGMHRPPRCFSKIEKSSPHMPSMKPATVARPGWWPERAPDFVIGQPHRPYLRRWRLLPRNRIFNILLHEILRSDDDRALHDHPWPFVSIIVRGSYLEIMPGRAKWRWRRSVIFHRARSPHRLVLARRCYTVCIVGPKIREWGFHCPNGWVHWRAFVATDNRGAIGRGCGED